MEPLPPHSGHGIVAAVVDIVAPVDFKRILLTSCRSIPVPRRSVAVTEMDYLSKPQTFCIRVERSGHPLHFAAQRKWLNC